jgi:hypothetical protein
MTTPEDYQIPYIHSQSKEPEQIASINNLDVPPDMIYMNPAYECKGVRL